MSKTYFCLQEDFGLEKETGKMPRLAQYDRWQGMSDKAVGNSFIFHKVIFELGLDI